MKFRGIVLIVAAVHLLLVMIAWGQADVIHKTEATRAWSRILKILVLPLSSLYQRSPFESIPFPVFLTVNSLLWGCAGLLLFLAVRAAGRAVARIVR